MDPVLVAADEVTYCGGGRRMLPPALDALYPLRDDDLGNVAERNGVDADLAKGEVVRS